MLVSKYFAPSFSLFAQAQDLFSASPVVLAERREFVISKAAIAGRHLAQALFLGRQAWAAATTDDMISRYWEAARTALGVASAIAVVSVWAIASVAQFSWDLGTQCAVLVNGVAVALEGGDAMSAIVSGETPIAAQSGDLEVVEAIAAAEQAGAETVVLGATGIVKAYQSARHAMEFAIEVLQIIQASYTFSPMPTSK